MWNKSSSRSALVKGRLAKRNRARPAGLFLAASAGLARADQVSELAGQERLRRRGLKLPSPATGPAPAFHLIDTTMMYAPRSGGAKRYLSAKQAWLEANRSDVRHTLVVPGPHTRGENAGLVTAAAAQLPFRHRHHMPASPTKSASPPRAPRPALIRPGH